MASYRSGSWKLLMSASKNRPAECLARAIRRKSGLRSSPSTEKAWRLVSRRACSPRSEEHTSELQSPCNLVCRLLLEKKKKTPHMTANGQAHHCRPPCPPSAALPVGYLLSAAEHGCYLRGAL